MIVNLSHNLWLSTLEFQQQNTAFVLFDVLLFIFKLKNSYIDYFPHLAHPPLPTVILNVVLTVEKNIKYNTWGSHSVVCWSAAAFGHNPVDVLARVLDVAGLAVDTVLGVNLQPHPVSCFHGNVLVHTWHGSLKESKLVREQAQRKRVDQEGRSRRSLDVLLMKWLQTVKEHEGVASCLNHVTVEYLIML